jgi:hypothetical protein
MQSTGYDMFRDHAHESRLGRTGESRVARKFRALGFDVAVAPKSRGVFDLCATRGDCTVLVQCKNYSSRQNANRRPLVLHKVLMSEPAPEGAIRLWWSRCDRTGEEFVWRVTPTSFEPWSLDTLASNG